MHCAESSSVPSPSRTRPASSKTIRSLARASDQCRPNGRMKYWPSRPGHRHREVVVDAFVELVQHRQAKRRREVDARLGDRVGDARRDQGADGHRGLLGAGRRRAYARRRWPRGALRAGRRSRRLRGRPVREHEIVQRLRRHRQAAVAPAHEVDPPRQAGQADRAGRDLGLLEVKERERRHDADAEAGANHAHHRRQLIDLHHRVHRLRMERRVEVLAHAARARQVDERPRGEVAQLDRLRGGERMVGAADEVEVVGAEDVGLQLGRLGAHRREREVGAHRRHALDAGLREHVGDVDRDAGIARPVAREDVGQPAGGERRQQRERDPAAAQRGAVVDAGDRGVELGEDAPRRRLEVGAFDRRRDVALAAIEEANAERLLEAADEGAERRLREVHRRRGAGEVALLQQERIGAELAQRCGHDLLFRSDHPNF